MENPGFYAILPASVRYDNRLKAAEKIFYAEITALSDQSGYCYAGNSYFASCTIRPTAQCSAGSNTCKNLAMWP